ncbi:hypothetical protein [Paenibacillus sp. J2TS4]|uniref:hypothetical protein n=1 Tax=Paenibacillus sp. J2TS4 TaxID=2807194 RepID=UPI001B287AA4|nr:hypothetical protein [Paenibacillus sp. J2TS4]GIP31512.1 hypothetical protein J2TS4_07220 [Paenibacillus sp. J2TS4]
MIEITKVMTPLNKLVNEKLIKFVSGELNMEADWGHFQEELDIMGYDKVLNLYLTKYAKLSDENKKLYTDIKKYTTAK